MRRMGGLKEQIPWTFWTMTAATFAIAGFPPFAGFFSKDEILFRAAQVSLVYWGIGVFTAFLTSFYMFRLWFLTFFGTYRGTEPAEEGHGGHGHGEHGHGGIHESPKVMLAPLVVLAVLSLAGGWVGSARFEKFLSPVFNAAVVTPAAEVAEHGSEMLFTGISVFAAAFGLYLAWLFYYRRPELPQQIASGLGGLYEAVVHKYYVDELYANLFVKPLIAGSSLILWRGIDRDVIDATLDNSAHGANEVSDSFRHMQSGNLRSYAGWVAAGAAVVIAYMIWMGTR